MRYSNIDKFEIVNGSDVGISFYTQGCLRHCKGCFNQEAWSLDGGKPYTDEVKEEIIEACKRPGIKRFSILGGEPLLEQNREELSELCALVKGANKDIKIWLYTGNVYEEIINDWYRFITYFIDVLVDGPFILEQRDITLPFRGSSNQRIIDIKKTIKEGEIVNYE